MTVQRRRILNIGISIFVLTVLAGLYGLSFYLHPPKYWESAALASIVYALFTAAIIRFIPHLISLLAGDLQPHLVQTGDRTFRRFGTRELSKLILMIMVLRLFEVLLTYALHYFRFGYSGTFFEVQRMWLDFYHSEKVFPLYGYLSDVFWIFTFNFNHARFIGSYVFTAFAGAALYALVLFDFDRRTARRAVRYFFFLPVSCLLLGTVPDGLFLLLSILSLLFMRRRQFALANLLAMFATLTHALGVLLFFPILAEYIAFLVANLRSNREMGKGYLTKQILNAVSFILIPIGIVLVMLYSLLQFHDALALYRAVANTSSFDPTAFCGNLFRWFDSVLDSTKTVTALTVPTVCATVLPQLLYLIAACLLILFSVGRIDTSYVLLLLITIPAILITNHPEEAAQLLTITAPFSVALASCVRKRWLDYMVTILLLIGWIAYFYAFICGYTGGVL